MHRRRKFVLLMAFWLVGALGSGDVCRAESPQQRDRRTAWWREARLGMFVHWGLYSVAAGHWDGKPVPGLSSWTLHTTKAPLEEYVTLKDRFNPSRFDADQMVLLAKRAGMKYLVITTRHHEGFSLFDSDYSDFDVMATPYKRDIMRQVAEACRRHDMRLGWYYSILDWYHPDYTPRRPGDNRPTDQADYSRYVRFMKSQLHELLTDYGKIDVLWFDGSWDPTFTNEQGQALYDYARSLQPDIIINNRLGKGPNRPGDFGTPEQMIPANAAGADDDWETCMTINDTWGFKSQDQNWKSTTTLVQMLAECASKGGNFLLNVGPAPDGTIPQPSVDRLLEMGRWLEANGRSIYGTEAGPYERRLPWGCSTRTNLGNDRVRLYLHVFNWPDDGELTLPRIANKPLAAHLLTDAAEKSLAARQEDVSIRVKVGPKAPDKHDSVIVLDIEGQPKVTPFRIEPASDGTFELPARDADVHGRLLHYDGQPGRESLGHWTRSKDWVSWPIRVRHPGRYRVEICYGCAAGSGDGEYCVEVAGQKIEGRAHETGGWFQRDTDVAGTVDIKQAGDYQLELRVTKKPGLAVFDVKKLVLRLLP